MDDRESQCVEECADIVIILSRLVERFGRDLMFEVRRKTTVNRPDAHTTTAFLEALDREP